MVEIISWLAKFKTNIILQTIDWFINCWLTLSQQYVREYYEENKFDKQ